MLNLICPKCGKDPAVEVINVLPGRRYEIRCKRCGSVFTAEAEKPALPKPPPKEKKPTSPE